MLTALTTLTEFRRLEIRREGSSVVIEMEVGHPELGDEPIRASLSSFVNGEDPEKMIMALFGICCVRVDQELHRSEHVPAERASLTGSTG
jgi:hypothetical protein